MRFLHSFDYTKQFFLFTIVKYEINLEYAYHNTCIEKIKNEIPMRIVSKCISGICPIIINENGKTFIQILL